MKSLGVADVATHRFDNPEAPTVCITTNVAVNLALPLVEVLLRLVHGSPHDQGHLTYGGALRRAPTLRAQPTRPAGAPRAPVLQCLQSPPSRWPPLLDIRCPAGQIACA